MFPPYTFVLMNLVFQLQSKIQKYRDQSCGVNHMQAQTHS